MPRSYLVRFGLARSVALFSVDPESAIAAPDLERLARGDWVVVRTHRGTDLGEVLGPAPRGFDTRPDLVPRTGDPVRPVAAPLLRLATPMDRKRAQEATARRSRDYEAAVAILNAGSWPIDLIDVEPLLDEGRTVLHYLGPHQIDAADLVAAFRDRLALDVVLEPAGPNLDGEADDDVVDVEVLEDDGCGSCGSKAGGCGSCSTASGCAVKALVGSRRARSAGFIP